MTDAEHQLTFPILGLIAVLPFIFNNVRLGLHSYMVFVIHEGLMGFLDALGFQNIFHYAV